MAADSDLEETTKRLRFEGGRALRALSAQERVSAVKLALASLRPNALGHDAITEIAESTSLSAANVEHALDSALEGTDDAALEKANAGLRAEALAVPAGLTTIVLAQNVFTAGLYPSLWSLLAGSPLLLKAPSGDAVFHSLFVDALKRAHPAFDATVGLAEFGRGDTASLTSLIDSSDLVHVFGSDETAQHIRATAPANTHVVLHGHAVGFAHVSANAELDAAAKACALDIAAYDQRGCMSPQSVFVPKARAQEFASLLMQALNKLQLQRPLGPRDIESDAATMQWRAAARVRGELLEGVGGAVAIEPASLVHPIFAPGRRQIGVIGIDDTDDILPMLRPHGEHVKTVGVAGTRQERVELAQKLAEIGCSPRVCQLGAMQRPSLLSDADGRSPHLGLRRRASVE